MKKQGLYDPSFEHDACGVGFVANINGRPTRQIIKDGITILKNLIHRGALGGDKKTGDGAGILTQIPHKFFAKVCQKEGITLPDKSAYGVAMLFMPEKNADRKKVQRIIETEIKSENAELIGSREVPINTDCLGPIALSSIPFISQIFVKISDLSGEELETKLYILRRKIENSVLKEGFDIDHFYIPSFSSKTIVYKGMLVGAQVGDFYPDLNDSDFTSALALIHQRYSTNTFPSWALAQPFRYVAHNGEINTLRGNSNKMNAREKTMKSPRFGKDLKKLFPIINPGMSDSGSFDNVFELLSQTGRSIEHSMMMMVPEAFGNRYHISEDKRAFYDFHASIMEPWDGPAAMTFTDGDKIGATLDRNGLRPARYVITKSNKIVLASEVGVIEVPAEEVLHKGRLAPGKMLLVDLEKQRVIRDNEIKSAISRQKPYRRWLEKHSISLKGLFQAASPVKTEHHSLLTRQKIFGYNREDIKMTIKPMAKNSQEPVNSMGNDSTLAVLSDKPQLLYNYFKQMFAQVTNPPIDPYRENLVMSLMSFVGREGNLLEENADNCHQLKLSQPILTNEDTEKLKNVDIDDFRSAIIDITFIKDKTQKALKDAISEKCKEAEKAIDDGASLIILSDREVDEVKVPIPALLATSSIHQHLVKKGKRHRAGLLVETGEAREVMHFATLVGYGASAINPYLVFETIAELKSENKIPEDMKLEEAIDNYITAVKKGLLKVMSKIGISTIRSYRGAQIFEAIGLNEKVVDKYFTGTPSRIGGIGLDKILEDIILRHDSAFELKAGPEVLQPGGNIHLRTNDDKHLITAQSVALIQKAVREGDYNIYKQYSTEINDNSEKACTIRGLLDITGTGKKISIDDVEPVESIIKRFVTPAMSLGSISKEAHETMAIAMNRLGSASNSGEGGESEDRYIPLENGDSKKSAIKQVASARFGVTSNYLVNSRELQIKMAQGAKPGEGGQLPGHKVDKMIASIRHSTPGVMLISPPPHHDIYSIEDLAQLIFDLKNANNQARISVKLVSEVGVGTVAAGVAKGKADMVLISGHDGGTGASPISSIKHAGMPWEIGLAETQQTLVLNKLRDRIRVQTDGKLKTGRDVIIAALLGAEEYGFGTMSLITMGCVMMRKCHLNTCPVGVATQDPELRKKFPGKPEHVINFMTFIAKEVREQMAELGFKTIDEMIGQVQYLKVNNAIKYYKDRGLDFSKILTPSSKNKDDIIKCISKQEHDMSLSIDQSLIENSMPAIENQDPVTLFASIRNYNRTVGTTLSSEVSRRYGAKGLSEDTIRCKFTGSAGQSFGAFLAPGITFELEGDANDYYGKGLSGGKLIVAPPPGSTFRSHANVIVGNVCLFGATGGEAYINGIAGERFAVRNSGATAVVVGVGDHGCEYMTGGTVVVLGKTGINFAAGMSGGTAYILDTDQLFDTRCNLDMVDIEPVSSKKDQQKLHQLISNHANFTGSQYSARIIEDWEEMLPQFVKVMPIDYKNALKRIKAEEDKETDSVAITEEVFR